MQVWTQKDVPETEQINLKKFVFTCQKNTQDSGNQGETIRQGTGGNMTVYIHCTGIMRVVGTGEQWVWQQMGLLQVRRELVCR